MEEITRCIEQAAAILDRTAGVSDQSGVVVACTDSSRVGSVNKLAAEIFASDDAFAVTGETSYMKFGTGDAFEYVCFIEGTDQSAQINLELLVNWLKTVVKEEDQNDEREALLKNILLENELPGDIPLKAREYSIPYAAMRVVYVVRVAEENNLDSLEVMRSMFPNRKIDFVLAMDENNIALVKEFNRGADEEIGEVASQIQDTLIAESMASVKIAIGMPTETLKDCAKSFREATLALTIGGIFNPEKSIIRYDKLGLGRLIYQLPPTLCKMFLDEVFVDGSYEELDLETLTTIDTFFDNDLNGSETSRQLFVHRNTLVYRLDKAHKITGLDVRQFEDAVLFKLATMVRRYLEYLQKTTEKNSNKWWKA